MKNLTIYILLAAVCGMAACKKKETPVDRSVTAQIRGMAWVSSSTKVTFSKAPDMHVTILADSANTRLQLDINRYTGPGTYIILDTGTTASYTSYHPSSGNYKHIATSGQIVVTENNFDGGAGTAIKGTFRFLADTVDVQVGAFDVKLNFN